jgi:hypothetical protein
MADVNMKKRASDKRKKAAPAPLPVQIERAITKAKSFLDRSSPDSIMKKFYIIKSRCLSKGAGYDKAKLAELETLINKIQTLQSSQN